MNKLDKKQRTIIIVSVGIIAIVICYYAYAKENTLKIEQDLELEEITKQEDKENTENEADAEETIKVHISGAVNNEGLIELEQNARIADAIEKAGGTTENACIEEINLAYMLEDGMKIRIPTREEVENQKKLEGKTQEYAQVQTQEQSQEYMQVTQKYSKSQDNTQTQTSTQNGGTAPKQTNSKININTATQQELETLPGIGSSTALKIINYRKENGNFKSIDEIKEVSGIGESKYNKIKDLIKI